MTSILEALRELEEERRRTRTERSVSVVDAPGEPPAATSMLYPLIAGLAVGVLAVGGALWWSGVGAPLGATAPTEPVPAASGVATAGPGDSGLAWLERADAPIARVARNAPSAGAASTAPSTRAAIPTAPRPAATARASGRADSVTVESIRYDAAPERRSVTLRLDGRRVTLRQGERSAGIEVQLIMKDGAYLNRGSDVIFAVPAD